MNTDKSFYSLVGSGSVLGAMYVASGIGANGVDVLCTFALLVMGGLALVHAALLPE